jgi:hypothetical protein
MQSTNLGALNHYNAKSPSYTGGCKQLFVRGMTISCLAFVTVIFNLINSTTKSLSTNLVVAALGKKFPGFSKHEFWAVFNSVVSL